MSQATDNSILTTTSKCHLKTGLEYGWRLTGPDESAYLRMGSAGHEALATHLRGAKPSTALRTFDRLYEDWATAHNVDETRGLAHANIRDIIEVWLARHPVASLPWDIDADLVEVGFKVPLDDNGDFMLVGKDDLIGFHKRDHIAEVVDHKFRGGISPWWASQFENASQGTGYIYTLRHPDARFLAGYDPDSGNEGEWISVNDFVPRGTLVDRFHINAIDTRKLPEALRRCPEHGKKYPECRLDHVKYQILGPFIRYPEQIREWRKTAIELAKQFSEVLAITSADDGSITQAKIDALPKQGEFSGECNGCQFRNWCSNLSRDVDIVKRNFTRNEWQPFPGAFEA